LANVRSSEDRPLRIALYSPELPESDASNGNVTYSRIMRDALRLLGHSVAIITPEHVEHADGRIVALPPPRGLIGRLRKFVEASHRDDGSDTWIRLRVMDAFEAVRRAGVDVVEIEESFGWAGRLAGRGVAIIERLHGPHVFGREVVEHPEQRRLGDLREAAELRSLLKVQAVTCPSRRLLDAMIARYALELSVAHAIPNPMPVVPQAAAWRVEHADPNQILCVGRFDLRKGADVVVRAFARALDRRPSLRLVIAGPDTGLMHADGHLVHFDEFAARELSPETRASISFLGVQPTERISDLRFGSALALVASRFESFGYTVAEAMAIGMPVVASNSFGPPEIIRDGVDGRIVPVGDIDATADAMVDMVSNPDRLGAMGKSAYSRAASWLSPARIAEETVAVYREALSTM
jgi:glycosyltransferase involved in cell wall biosynthesis